MTRIFGIVAGLSTLMILLAACGAYWFSAADAKNAKATAATAIANSLAASLSLQLETLQNSVDGLAKSPDVIAALNSSNPEIIQATANKLQGLVPFNLRLRLLLPNVSDPDQTQLPHMGFGDLDMVHSTLTTKPKPVIQGEGEHRHLAITSAVLNDSKVLGVVLASLKPDIPQKVLAQTTFNHGLIELKQDQLVLGKVGDMTDTTDIPSTIDVPLSRWKINVWTQLTLSPADIGILTALITVPALLTCLAFFVGYRKFNDSFHQDQLGILKAAKDMFQGKTLGSYPMQLEEMQPVITAMAQFKRVMDQGGLTTNDTTHNKDHDFFDESFNLDFLEETTPVTVEQFTSVPINTSAIHLDTPHQDTVTSLNPLYTANMGIDVSFIDTTADTTESAAMESWEMPDDILPISPPKPKPDSASEKNSPNDPFRSYEISGIFGQDISEGLFTDIGKAFASEALNQNVKTIVVGRDARLSSSALASALIQGLTSCGCDVLDLGLVPTPILYFVSHHSEGRTGIMVTGSQLAASYNGLKMMLTGSLVAPAQIQNLKSRIEQRNFQSGSIGSVEQNSLFSNEYIGVATEDCHLVRPMTVVLDCGNGATGQLGPILLKTLGCDVIELHTEYDGQFPNHLPDPGNPANLEALIKAVKLNNADLGLAFDGDGESLGLVDSAGRIIWADRQMMLFARDVLASKPGNEVLYDVASSKHLPEQIKKRGGHAVLCKSGSYSLQARLRETGALLAGDMDGHFLFNDRWFGFSDALYASVRLIEILSADMRSTSELFDDLPYSLSTPQLEAPISHEDPAHFIEKLLGQASFPDGTLINMEGMRVEFQDGWGLVRASNFKSALVFRFEANSQESLDRIQGQFKSLILQLKTDISLPF